MHSSQESKFYQDRDNSYLKINIFTTAALHTRTSYFQNVLSLLILNCKLRQTRVPGLSNKTSWYTRRSLDDHLQKQKNILKSSSLPSSCLISSSYFQMSGTVPIHNTSLLDQYCFFPYFSSGRRRELTCIRLLSYMIEEKSRNAGSLQAQSRW